MNACSLGVLAGCQASPAPMPLVPPAVATTPGIGVRLSHLQAVPTSFARLLVGLYSPTVNTSYDPSIHTRNVLSSDGGYTLQLGAPVVKVNEPGARFVAATLDGTGAYYAIDAATQGVKKYSANGAPVALATPITGLGGPTSLAVDNAGNIYVADNVGNKLLRFDATGSQTLAVPLTSPWGVAVDGAGAMYVTENVAAGTLKRVADDGTVTPLATGLDFPCGVALGLGGRIFVGLGGTSNRLQAFDAAGTPQALPAISTELTRDFQVSADAQGTAYAATPNGLLRYDDLGNASAPAAAPAGSVMARGSNVLSPSGSTLIQTPAASGFNVGDLGFGVLRPAADYTGRVYVLGASGALLATCERTALALQAGPNAPDFTLVTNGQAATFGVAGAPGFTKGDVVTVNTGVAANLPAVAWVDVTLGGNAYLTGATIAHLTTAAGWNAFSWDTGADNLAAPCNYAAAKLSAGSPATLTFMAFDDHKQLLSSWSAPVTVN